jgi:AraC-like DNA-binding protein
MTRSHIPLTLQHRLGGYREYRAPIAALPFAESAWTYAVPAGIPAASHRVLPDFALDIEFVCRRDANGRLTNARLLLGGPSRRPRIATFHPHIECVAIKVKLEWATPVTGLCPSDHFDQTFDLFDVNARLAHRLLDSLAETRSKESALSIMAAVIAHGTADRIGRRRVVAGATLDLIRRTHGTMRIPRLAHNVGLSERHVRKIVERDAGIGLKTYARTVRFLRAITIADQLPAATPIAWSTIAANVGFYDQSHLIHDCQALSGLTPGDLMRERRAQRVAQTVMADPSDT